MNSYELKDVFMSMAKLEIKTGEIIEQENHFSDLGFKPYNWQVQISPDDGGGLRLIVQYTDKKEFPYEDKYLYQVTLVINLVDDDYMDNIKGFAISKIIENSRELICRYYAHTYTPYDDLMSSETTSKIENVLTRWATKAKEDFDVWKATVYKKDTKNA